MRLWGTDGCFRWSVKGFSLWRAGGGLGVPYVYGLGSWSGKDLDLLCIRDFGARQTNELEPVLSPLDRNILVAFVRLIMAKRTRRIGS